MSLTKFVGTIPPIRFDTEVRSVLPVPSPIGYWPPEGFTEALALDADDNGGCNDLRGASWMVVTELVAREREMLRRLFDRPTDLTTLQQEAEHRLSDIWPMAYRLLPIGTIACVGALNAAGCPTVWSNNGLSSDGYALHAHVSFFAKVDRIELLVSIANRANVRLNGGSDQLELVPRSADGLFHFAEEMLEASDEWVASRPLDPDEQGMPDPLEVAGVRGTKH